MCQSSRGSPDPGENRYSMVQGGDSVGKTVRESPDRGENRYFTIQGVSGRKRHRLDQGRIANTGRESIFSDTGCVRPEKT